MPPTEAAVGAAPAATCPKDRPMASIVLFEDHTALRFAPLAASTPLPEVRCGLFCLRERVNLVASAGGWLAVRPSLAALNRDEAWRPLVAGDRPGLWLNGRLAPSPTVIADLVAAADRGPFLLRDAGGPLAIAADGAWAQEIVASWFGWSGSRTGEWSPPVPADWTARDGGQGATWLLPAGATVPAAATSPALGWIWDIVPRTAAALKDDLAAALRGPWRRRPFGLDPQGGAAPWPADGRLRRTEAGDLPGVVVVGDGGVYVGEGVTAIPGAVVDTRSGPVILQDGASIGAHVYLEGPLALGPLCRVKAGAAIYGESSFGLGCRVAGEIGESSFGDFSNKQHEGFIGHAVLGSWVNLGALTTCSDLKNNYGNVRVDLGRGSVDTGLRFVGLLMGDHAKTAIGTLFNTGTCVGFAANVFGDGMPPKLVPAFSWGGRDGSPAYDADKAAATAAIVLGRRGCTFGEAHAALFRELAASSR